MGEKHIQARKNYWSKIDPIERSRRAALAATIKWSRIDANGRKAHSLVMLSGKNKNGKENK